ncbi:MAG: DUF1638 domain-containing protein [Desulfamplus sp.]|nr:DUF1638 domain-containing protein [Desulfamplus sp.]
MRNKHDNITIISCSLFRNEIEALFNSGELQLPVVYLDSILHIYPEKLRAVMDKAILREVNKKRQVILLYGECHAYIYESIKHPDVERVKGLNCIEIIVGKEKYKQIRKERIFCFLPEWINRWEDIFRGHLGLNRENSRSFMQDMHSGLLYLDTGRLAVPPEIIKDIEDYTGLKMDIMPVTSAHLLASINDAYTRLAR